MNCPTIDLILGHHLSFNHSKKTDKVAQFSNGKKMVAKHSISGCLFVWKLDVRIWALNSIQFSDPYSTAVKNPV
jgi:hypothetical protein